MFFRSTAKAAKKLKIVSLNDIRHEPAPFSEWYINIFTVQRRQYFLVTDSQTLFSVIFEAKYINETDTFYSVFIRELRKVLLSVDCEKVFKKYIEPDNAPNLFAKSSNRAVIGSMNDMIRMADFHVMYRGDSMDYIIKEIINDGPHSYIKTAPVEMVKKYNEQA